MIKSLIIAIVAIIMMMVGWVFVQTLWRKIFTGSYQGEDVLAGRKGCMNCSCLLICKNK
jgi:hypothetical protein